MSDTRFSAIELVDKCPLCRSRTRETLYSDVSDPLYGVPGEWSYKRCLDCTLVFLDPRPTEGEIGKAYVVYPTHASEKLPDDPLRRIRSYVAVGYLARKFGYDNETNFLHKLAGSLMYLHPGQREYTNGSIMYLSAARRGKVLDVGAGSGELLAKLRGLKWEVEGIDPDPQAAESVLRNHGIKIETGTLPDAGYPSDHFDAVTMSHVIEHVHDPVALLKECRRVMKPGGSLIISTPNARSLGHYSFGRYWRSVEPPRHLILFSRKTLLEASRKAGLSPVSTITTVRGADGVFVESRQIERNRGTEPHTPAHERLAGHLYQYFTAALLRFKPDVGEDLLLVAIK